MSKAHRGKGIRELYAYGRGECPICKKKNIKVLYEQEAGDQKFKLCKVCKAAVKNGTKSLPVTASSKPAAAVETAAETAAAEAKPAVAATAPAAVEEPAAAEEPVKAETAAEEPASEPAAE